MTETADRSRAVNEITTEDYDAIAGAAYDLHGKINSLLDTLYDPADPAWVELYELMQLANVMGSAATRYRNRARLSPEPVDYRPLPYLPAESGTAYQLPSGYHEPGGRIVP